VGRHHRITTEVCRVNGKAGEEAYEQPSDGGDDGEENKAKNTYR